MKKKPAAPDRDDSSNPPIFLRLPMELGIPLLRDATAAGCTIQNLILQIVARHYDLQAEIRKPGRPFGKMQ